MIYSSQHELSHELQETLTTKRLVLRQLKDNDAVALSKYGSDFDIARMTGSFPHPFPLLSAESTGEKDMYFSTARMEKTESVLMERCKA